MDERRKQITNNVMLRIAELKIAAYGLKDTPQEYVEKAKAKNETA